MLRSAKEFSEYLRNTGYARLPKGGVSVRRQDGIGFRPNDGGFPEHAGQGSRRTLVVHSIGMTRFEGAEV
jgi:hypothetical protein